MAILLPSVKPAAKSLSEPIYGSITKPVNAASIPKGWYTENHKVFGLPSAKLALADDQSTEIFYFVSMEVSIICTMRSLVTFLGLISQVGMPIIMLLWLLYHRLATAKVEIVREDMSG